MRAITAKPATASNAMTILPSSIDAVITSPPYPNEKDYTRTMRLESVLLGFVSNKAELQVLGSALKNTIGWFDMKKSPLKNLTRTKGARSRVIDTFSVARGS